MEKARGRREGLTQVTDSVRSGLTELRQAYASMLHRLREILLTELEAPNALESALAELRARAENVRQLSGDHRMEAFITRLAQFQGSDEEMEGLASLATNKPVSMWVDPDVDRATVELAELAQRFKRLEAYAHVKGRPDGRHAMALVVGQSGKPKPLHAHFDVTDLDQERIDTLLLKMQDALSGEERPNVILAALVELSAQYLSTTPDGDAETSANGKELAS